MGYAFQLSEDENRTLFVRGKFLKNRIEELDIELYEIEQGIFGKRQNDNKFRGVFFNFTGQDPRIYLTLYDFYKTYDFTIVSARAYREDVASQMLSEFMQLTGAEEATDLPEKTVDSWVCDEKFAHYEVLHVM